MAVVTDDRDALLVFEFQVDFVGHFMIRVADDQSFTANRGSLFRLNNRCLDISGGLLAGDFVEFEPFELFLFGSRLAGGVGIGSVFVDELFELFLFGGSGCVFTDCLLSSLVLKFEELGDLAGVHCQFAGGQVEGVLASFGQERSVVRDHQTGLLEILQEVFEQNLSSQIQEVGRFVQQQQVRLVQQQRCQLHTRLPSTRKSFNRAEQVITF